MAEIFGVAAGVLTVIDLSAKIITTLESLQYLSAAESDFSDTIRDLNEVEGAVKGCRNTIEELAAELDGLAISKNAQTILGKRQMLKGSLRWCLKESRARKLLEEAIQHKSTISLALLSEAARDIKELKRSVGKLRKDLDATQRRQICDWIEHVNPTRNHNDALKLRDDQTCCWILRHIEWQKWLSGTRRFIWIHGIPGAGKTILASYIIEQIRNVSPTLHVKNACLYFYCSYRHTDNQTSSFLRWMVSQLCRQLQYMPQDLLDLYNNNSDMTIEQLKAALSALLGEIGLVYVVLDAIDECNTKSDVRAIDAPGARRELLQLLESLLTDPEFDKVQIVATSRNYRDIEDSLEPLSVPISMSNPLVDEDIRTYVGTQLRTNDRFSRWSTTLLNDIKDALAEGAKGMFRWASCQIHILQRKRSESEIRKALKELPETLDETYERIFLDIPRDEWDYVRTALLWICAHDSLDFEMGIPANCLVSAVFSRKTTDHLAEQHAYDSAYLQEICGCLIRSSNFDFAYENGPISEGDGSFETINLAHYTVKEFIYSERIANTTINYFFSSEENTTREFLGAVLRLCATINLEARPSDFFENLHEYCRAIAQIAPLYWEDTLIKNDDFLGLLFRYFDSPRYDRASETWESSGVAEGVRPSFVWDSISYPLATRQSLVLLSLLDIGAVKIYSRFVENLDFESIICAPLEVRMISRDDYFRRKTILEVLYKLFRLVDANFGLYSNLLNLCKSRLDSRTRFTTYLATHDHFVCGKLLNNGIECPIEELLQDGVNPDTPGLSVTPLQIAVSRWDYYGTKLLLQHHANPNRTGDPNGKHIPNLDPILGRKSPLHITRKEEPQFDGTEDFYIRGRKVERILLEHGAKDFVMDKLGTCVATGGQTRLLEGGTDSEESRFEEDESQYEEDENQYEEDESRYEADE
ncbi:hypothetical protein K505DRAFT_26200 [Melanomma pulvis-pyrius CBS 109.77]|uniref:NACHT domain-containing protein n=1 Tax=Melanomma pulvis-pyrius CBS 109.77 TaxID=1314802 RepID=A0A6A6XDD0_9PLEO|nr:hypothetical protein K505DRAFT_26200 [Melanomma pulvis-pyrius CBS 109.77]